MRIGAHVSSAGGISKVFERAAAIEAEAIQLFLSAPQQWRSPSFPDAEVELFAQRKRLAEVPVFAHAPYLVNFGSSDEALCERSVAAVAAQLDWCGRLGLEGLIVHVGSHLGAGFEAVLAGVARHIGAALDRASTSAALLVLENNAGQGGGIGGRFEELGAIISERHGDPRLAICLDTCHALAMGYDVTNPGGVDSVVAEFDRWLGLSRLVAVHANDSKVPLGGVRDRHENIGDGHIGWDGFRALVGHPAFASAPFLLEVPGLDGKGPDLANVRRLKEIRETSVRDTSG